jgi:hypothetical protein
MISGNLQLLESEGQTQKPRDEIERAEMHRSNVPQGQELSKHTAAKPAMLFFAKGEAGLGLGDVQEAQPGTWIHMRRI